VSGASETASAAEEARNTDSTVANMAEAAKRTSIVNSLDAEQTNCSHSTPRSSRARGGRQGLCRRRQRGHIRHAVGQGNGRAGQISVQKIAAQAVQAIRGISQTVDVNRFRHHAAPSKNRAHQEICATARFGGAQVSSNIWRDASCW
jgi:hypothetical protein